MFRSARDVVNIPKPENTNSAESNGPDLYGCDLCTDGGWVSETEVELHKTKEHYSRAFLKSVWQRGDYCCICVKKCSSKDAVLRHIKKEHLLSSEQSLRVEREIFVCDHCTAVFFNQKNLMIHLRYSHKPHRRNATVMCMLCARNIKTRNIPAHFYMHQIQSVSTCRICLEKFRNTRVLEKHIRRHPLFLKCSMCQFETDRSDSFHDHVLNTHKTLSKNVSLMTSETNNREILMTSETNNRESLMTSETNNRGSLMTSETNNREILMTSETNNREILMTSETNNRESLIKNETKSDNGDYEVYCDENDDSGMYTVIQICDDGDVTENTTDSQNLITVNDLISDVIKDEVIDPDLMTAHVKQEPSTGDEVNFISPVIIPPCLMTGEIKKENESILMTDETKADNDITEDIIMDDVKDGAILESLITKDVNTTESDFRSFFIPKRSVFVKLQKVAGIKGLILTNDVHICVLCREICVGSEQMRVHVYEHTFTVKTEKKYEYECSCGEGFHSKLLLRHHTFKTKHVADAK